MAELSKRIRPVRAGDAMNSQVVALKRRDGTGNRRVLSPAEADEH